MYILKQRTAALFRVHTLSRVLLLFCISAIFPALAADPDLFPRPPEIEADVRFWVKVFTEADTTQGFIHDDRYLGVIYEKINVPQGIKRRAKQKYIEDRKDRFEKILNTLASGKRSGLSQDEKRVLDLWPENVDNNTLKTATKHIRFQLGQSDKYLAGLKRSGAWRDHIIKTLDDMGLPREIASLPHVESSFNPKAYSKVGAAGLWQFTRSTGRRFMRVDHVVDERMDPFKASVAAARLLENNYSVTGTWPLALTAYNHGAAGMRNAAQSMGTTDITTILRKYKSRSFKFASRNFYVAFLAAVEVEHNAEKFFGKVQLNPPIVDELVSVPGYMNVTDISKALGLSVSYLQQKNPGLRPLVWRKQKYVPKGYEIRIGKNDMPADVVTLQSKLKASRLFARQKRDIYHKVRRGQTLSNIARRYGVQIRDLMAVNNLRSRHRIRVGQRLRLPQKGSRTMLAQAPDSPLSIPESGIYKVRRGDTIDRIARRHKLKAKNILAYNNLGRKGRIYPGQKLRLKPYPAATTIAAKTPQANEVTPTQVATADSVKEESPTTVTTSDTPETAVAALDQKAQEQAATAEVDQAQTEDSTESTAAEATETTTAEATGSVQNDESLSSGAIGGDAIQTDETISENVIVVSDTEVADETTVAASTDVDQLDDKTVEQVAKLQPVEEPRVKKELTLDQVLDKQMEALDQGTAFPENNTDTNLAADPTDYSVTKNATIVVQAAETLGHYADWLKVTASKLRRINRLRYGKPVIIGKKIKLVFSKVSKDEFEKRRKSYHQSLQEAFFQEFEITGSDKHTIRRGDSVWFLAKRKYKIPIWLLRQYNPDLELNKIIPGTVVKFPKVVQKETPEVSKLPKETVAEAEVAAATQANSPAKLID
ncbi:MAG: LysM peptidoglycan-binding domain-containing protein [Gammaproteobacteria bacterium]|nr:LysM peptidoglycan-binding domain-containing protein [Gammaproteobacteria bacterium]MDH5800387.1 LysM peptidoglycan-binding domain-containing protein [Gammaproteobacteria bacterium]